MAILDDLCNRLSKDPPRLPSWVYVPTTSIAPVLDVIHYWIDMAKSAETEITLQLHKIPDHYAPTPPATEAENLVFPNPNNMNAYNQKTLQEVSASTLERMPGEQLIRIGLVPKSLSPSQARQHFERHKSQIVDAMVENLRAMFPSPNTDLETKWYAMTKTLPFPKELEARHTALRRLSDAVKKNGDIPKALITKVCSFEVVPCL